MIIVGRMSRPRYALKRLLPLVFAFAVPLAGCSSNAEPTFPEETAEKKNEGMDAPSEPEEKLPPGTIARKSLDQVLLRRPPWLLSRIEIEEVLKQNKFVGWRLIAFPADWDQSGLQPGDVVTDVNGIALEKPDDLWTAWVAVADAAEIRFGVERDGKPAATVVKIHGDPVPETKQALGDGVMIAEPSAPTAKKKKKGTRRDTVVITSDGNDNPDQFPEY